MWNIIWKKYYKNFFGCIFLGAHTIQTVPKDIWMQLCGGGMRKCLASGGTTSIPPVGKILLFILFFSMSFFLGAHTFQMLPKDIWMQHCEYYR